MDDPHLTHLETSWRLLLDGELATFAARLTPSPSWDDPLFGAASGAEVVEQAIPRVARWFQARSDGGRVAHLRSTADDRRVVVESVLGLRDGLTWNAALGRAETAERFQLATAIVGDRAPDGLFAAIRVYFGTWSVLDGNPTMRVGPICPDERARTSATIDRVPAIRRYFDCLARGDAAIIDQFEPDGYFREPANNYCCGREQLVGHFSHILKLGGVGVEFLTATLQDRRIALELQTVVWGPKRMPVPQAGFASYDFGPHGLVQGARVYDSVVPPAID